jgi:opacity protein-like surface antigen
VRNHLLPALAVAALLNAVGAVHAADLIEPAYEAPAPISTSGWYLRGDVGLVMRSKNSGDWDFYNQLPGVEGIDDTHKYESLEIDRAASFGGGLGYRFTDQLRADATVDYFKADVDGQTPCPFMVKTNPDGLALPFDAECNLKGSTEVAVWTAMANAYVDIGHFGPVTPYIGAGSGAAHVKYSDYEEDQVCGAPFSCPYTGTHDGMGSWRFASSLMAGATVDLTAQLKLDAGYRYTRIEGGDAYGYDAADSSFGATGTQGRDSGLDIHTVRAGLRYEFGGGPGFGL